MRVTEKCQGDLSPGPARSEGSITEGNRAWFCLHVPKFMWDKAGLGWPAWRHLKYEKLAFLSVRPHPPGSPLPSELSVRLRQGWAGRAD